MFRPVLFSEIKHYSREKFISDLFAGITVGVVALPLAMAFAIASGFSPERGLYTAIVAGFLISIFGGSKVQIGGPTGAFVVIVSTITMEFGYSGLVAATLMGGVILIILGVCRMGALIKFIPFPVIIGFTSGIAVVIFATQLNDLLGLGVEMPADFIGKLICCAQNLKQISPVTLGVAAFTVLVICLTKRFFPRFPAMLAGMLLATALTAICGFDIETIGSRFGDLPRTLPMPKLTILSWNELRSLVMPAFTIALLAAIESLLSATVADGMTGGDRHRPNTELIGQGIGNIGSALFGGIPSTGAIARTATNIKSGGQTPVAGIIHAITLALILLLLGPQAKMIPLAALAGIMAVVCWNMCEFRTFRHMFFGPRSDWAVMLVTFLLTVFIDLVVAVEVGVVLAALLFIRRMSEISDLSEITGALGDDEVEPVDDPDSITIRDLPPHVVVFEMQGPFFFGAVDKFRDAAMNFRDRDIHIIILRMRLVPAIDATGLNVLSDFLQQCRKKNLTLILSGVLPDSQPMHAFKQYGLVKQIGAENICPHIDKALLRARNLLAAE